MGPEPYWNQFRSNPAVKDWQNGLGSIAATIEQGIRIPVAFIELKNAAFVHGWSGTRSQLTGVLIPIRGLR